MKESLLTDVFMQAGFFLLLAALIVPALKYLRVPLALGYLLAGVSLGPYGLGGLESFSSIASQIGLNETEHVKVLAELGIVLLLFIIGLELTPQRLWQMRNLVFGLGGTQVAVTAIIIGTIAFLWGNEIKVSVLLGLGLALSSTALIMQWLQAKKLFATEVGRTSFSVLLFQDIAVIPILLLLTILSTEISGSVAQFVSISLVKMVLTILAIFIVGKIVLKPLFIFTNRHGGAEGFMALSILVIIVSALVANVAGLSMALGAFIAGLLLADTAYRHEIEGLILPFKSMLLGIFFISFGMGINLGFIAEKPFWLFASVVGLMGLKATIVFALCKLWKQCTAVAAESALLLSQSGEFGLLVVGSALAVGLMDQSVGQFMLIVIGSTMVLTTLLSPVARKIGASLEAKTHDSSDYDASEAEEIDGHVVVMGFGRVGQHVADKVCSDGLPYIAFDKDVEKVNTAQALSAPVYMGDLLKKNTLKAAQIEKALCVVLTIDDAKATEKIVKSIRAINSSTPIVLRARTMEDVETYRDMDHIDAVAENVMISNKLMKEVRLQIGYYEDKEDN